jgi:hypothetical protein
LKKTNNRKANWFPPKWCITVSYVVFLSVILGRKGVKFSPPPKGTIGGKMAGTERVKHLL